MSQVSFWLNATTSSSLGAIVTWRVFQRLQLEHKSYLGKTWLSSSRILSLPAPKKRLQSDARVSTTERPCRAAREHAHNAEFHGGVLLVYLSNCHNYKKGDEVSFKHLNHFQEGGPPDLHNHK